MPRGVRSSGPEGGGAPSSVQKACLILRAMSDARNARLTDIAQAAGQDKATTLRLLDVLARHGFVNRDPENKRYSLGPEIFALGAAAMSRSDPRAKVRPSLIQLVRTFEDTAILSVARGAESVAVDVHQGSFAIRANYLEVGSRRPLGVGAGIGQRKRRAPGAAKHRPAFGAERGAQRLHVGHQMAPAGLRTAAAGPRAAAAALVEQQHLAALQV